MFSNVLVTTDGSSRAEKAATYAIDLVDSGGGTLNVISVVDEDKPRSAGEIDPDFYEEIADSPDVDPGALELKRKAPETEFAKRIVDLATSKGVNVSSTIKVGNPVDEIIAAAEELGSDVIVIGSHGRGVVASALMGSVSSGVIHKGNTPVLVIPVHSED